MAKGLVPFLKTKDPGTKDQLIKEGFHLISSDNGVWTFLNDPSKMKSGKFSSKDLVYSNNLEF